MNNASITEPKLSVRHLGFYEKKVQLNKRKSSIVVFRVPIFVTYWRKLYMKYSCHTVEKGVRTFIIWGGCAICVKWNHLSTGYVTKYRTKQKKWDQFQFLLAQLLKLEIFFVAYWEMMRAAHVRLLKNQLPSQDVGLSGEIERHWFVRFIRTKVFARHWHLFWRSDRLAWKWFKKKVQK